MNWIAGRIRKGLIDIATNESLFLFTAFLAYGFLKMAPLAWYTEQINALISFVVVPWGAALCMLRLMRAQQKQLSAQWDIGILFVMLLWVGVPFIIRFGFTNVNVNNWFQNMVTAFGLYALMSEESAARREKMLDWASALFALISFVIGAALLYCAVTVQTWGEDIGAYGFGLYNGTFLTAGLYYNSTGMLALCCALMSLMGVFRRRTLVARLAHLVPAVMMMLVVVLTQSRTARYSLLASLAVASYSVVANGSRFKAGIRRYVLAVMVGAIVLVGGYIGSDAITRTAIIHYNTHNQNEQSNTLSFWVAEACAEEGQADSSAVSEDESEITSESLGRGLGDMTFTGRTMLWKKLFSLWAENPWHFLIGRGAGNTGKYIVQGTFLEAQGSATTHNTYLQFIADYGLIGMVIYIGFFISIIRPVMKVFNAKSSCFQCGYLVLCMIVIASLLTGMMESEPLAAMTPINAVLFFSLGALVNRGRECLRRSEETGRSSLPL